MCRVIISTHTCGCSSSVHIKCDRAKGADSKHFLGCAIPEETTESDQKCKRCLRAQAVVDSPTFDLKAKTKDRKPFGWTIRKILSRKQKKTEETGQNKTNFAIVEAPKQHLSLDVSPLPEITINQTPPQIIRQTPQVDPRALHIVQPTSTNPRLPVHPLRENAPTGVHPLRYHDLPRKPVVIISNKDELFCDDRPPSAEAAAEAEMTTKRSISHGMSAYPEHHKPTLASQPSELPEAVSNVSWHPQRIPDREPQKARPLPFEELFPDVKQYKPYRPPTSTDEVGPSLLTAIIPELQSHRPNGPPVNTDNLAAYLKDIASKSLAYPPYQPKVAEGSPTFFAHHPQRYTAVRHATIAALQQAELAPSLERHSEKGIPSCLLPGLKKEPTKAPQSLHRKKETSHARTSDHPKEEEPPNSSECERDDIAEESKYIRTCASGCASHPKHAETPLPRV